MKTASIYQNLSFNDHKPIINVLLETSFTKEIRIAMKKGTAMKAHKTAFPIVIELVDGTIDFGVQSDILSLKKGDLIALDANVVHDLKALEDTIIRLTLTKYDDADRVRNVTNK